MADKLKEKVKFFFGINNDDEYNYNEYDEEMIGTQEKSMDEEPLLSETIERTFMPQNIVKSGERITICKYTPKTYHEATRIIDDIKADKPVIVNLEEVDSESARKVLDICTGAIYALEGEISKISHNIFVLAPKNVDVLANLYDVESEDEFDEDEIID